MIMGKREKTGGLTASHVTVTYRNGHTALRDASFTVPTGTITALVGVNGSGKSTLFKAIMGFVPASKGSISLLGMAVRQALKRNIVAYVPQSEDVDWNFPVLVEDVVMMGRYGHMNMLRLARARDHAAVEAALARVGMAEFRKRQIGELSGGQRKRVFLARALAQDARIILLDEPFTAIDAKTTADLLDLVRRWHAEARTVVAVLHDIDTVKRVFPQTLLIAREPVAWGATAEVLSAANLLRARQMVEAYDPHAAACDRSAA